LDSIDYRWHSVSDAVATHDEQQQRASSSSSNTTPAMNCDSIGSPSRKISLPPTKALLTKKKVNNPTQSSVSLMNVSHFSPIMEKLKKKIQKSK
jgi:hypothetical protein